MVSNSFPQAYRVVSSAKLQISVSLMKRNKSLVKTLKTIGPSIDPYGIPRIISNHSLKDGKDGSGWKCGKSEWECRESEWECGE